MKGKKAGSSGRTSDLTMAERTEVEQIVEKVVSQVLDNHVPELRNELVRRVLEELPRTTGAAAAARFLTTTKATPVAATGTRAAPMWECNHL